MSEETKKRLIALAIGLGTIGAGLLTWRAGQIGSTANFDDRQSISQQVDEEAIRIEVTVEAARQARQYDRYVTEYAEAETLDDEAAGLRRAGDAPAAAVVDAEAAARREAATVRAFASGVFGTATLVDAQRVTDEPRPFDLERRIDELYLEATTGLSSTGTPQPQRWADKSDAIRARQRVLSRWVALLLTAIVLFTVAEVTISSRLRTACVALGLLVFAVVMVGGMARGFWA